MLHRCKLDRRQIILEVHEIQRCKKMVPRSSSFVSSLNCVEKKVGRGEVDVRTVSVMSGNSSQLREHHRQRMALLGEGMRVGQRASFGVTGEQQLVVTLIHELWLAAVG